MLMRACAPFLALVGNPYRWKCHEKKTLFEGKHLKQTNSFMETMPNNSEIISKCIKCTGTKSNEEPRPTRCEVWCIKVASQTSTGHYPAIDLSWVWQ